MRRQGWEGPSRCPMCLVEEENVDHLFLLCPFAKETWKEVMKMSLDKIVIPVNLQDMLKNWASSSPFCLNNKELLKTCWMWIPKFTCWKIWIERNSKIFKDKSRSSSRVVIKARAMMGEALEAKISLRNSSSMDVEEDHWVSILVPNHHLRSVRNPSVTANWEI